MNDVILKVKDLNTSFKVGQQNIPIIKNVNLEVYKGKMLAIVGESGCGKSVTMHSVVNLLPKAGSIDSGSVVLNVDNKHVELTELKQFGPEMRHIRGTKIGMVFQDPMSSLNPVYKVGDQVIEGLLQHNKGMKKDEALAKAIDLFKKLGIPDPENRIHDYPHQFSGGMKQRVMIAIAMINDPDLIIADEPTTALDVTIQAQIIDLLKKILEEENKSIVLITHNMGLVAEAADYAAVMYMGRVVEYAKSEEIFNNPKHPYTKALLRSVPVPGMDTTVDLETIAGQTPDPKDYVKGCEFANRCEFASQACLERDIKTTEIKEGHTVRCILFEGDNYEH